MVRLRCRRGRILCQRLQASMRIARQEVSSEGPCQIGNTFMEGNIVTARSTTQVCLCRGKAARKCKSKTGPATKGKAGESQGRLPRTRRSAITWDASLRSLHYSRRYSSDTICKILQHLSQRPNQAGVHQALMTTTYHTWSTDLRIDLLLSPFSP
jgi:hypothetical protein